MEQPTREELLAWDRWHVWHGFTQMAEYEPLVLVEGQGCRVRDLEGRWYLDGVASLWCNVHGHRHPVLDAAIRAQLERVAHVTNLGASNVTAIQLARRLAQLAPPGLEHVFFSDDGSTAVEVALKMAFQYWQQRPDPRPEKKRFLALAEAYHGDTLGSVSVGGVELFHAKFRPLLFECFRAPAPDTYRTPPGVPQEHLTIYYLQQVENILQAHHHEIAAMIVEPLVQCAAGILVHPPGFLQGLRELTRKYQVLLIADEVAVGFGRTGRMFACQHEDVQPDFLCLAKGLTGGYLPMAATLTTTEIWNAFLGRYEDNRTFFHGHTYGGNPLAAAVALANLDLFDKEHLLESLPPKIDRLRQHLERIGQLEHVGHVRQCGLIAGIELVRDRAAKEPYPRSERRGWRVCLQARTEGVLLRPLGDVVVIFPPLAISLEELDLLCGAIERSIVAICKER